MTPHTHSFKLKNFADGSVLRVCSCGERVIDLASGKFAKKKQKDKKGKRKYIRRADAVPLF